MLVQGKVWGRTALIFKHGNVEVHRLEGNEGGFCSEHKHDHKYNEFFIESGKVKVIEWKEESGTIDETILSSLESCVIPPGSFHKFEILEDSVFYEIYWVELDSSDIVRRVSGGNPDTPGATLT